MRTRSLALAATALVVHAWRAGGLAAQVPADTTLAPDTTVYILEPLVVGVARERAAPPPVIAETVDPAVVQQSQETNPYRMLRQTTGVEVHDQGQGPGFASNVTIRGFTSDHSSDVLLVIDGVPVNLPAHGHIEGYADWNVLMGRSVSSMRVIHGGASPLYGDFALGGVVEVFTRAEADGLEGAMGATSFGDVRADIAGGHRSEGSGTFLGGAFQRNEGWRDNSDYWLTNGIARGWRTMGEGRLEGGVSVYATKWNSPGFVSIPRFNEPELAAAVDPSDGGDSRRVVANGRYSTPIGTGTFLQTALWGMASDYGLFLNIPGHNHDGVDQGIQIQSGEWDERIGAGAQAEIARTLSGGGDLVVGVSGRADGVAYRHAATFQRDVLSPEIDLNARHAAGALYGRWRRTFAGSLGVDLGARMDVLSHRSRPNPAAVQSGAGTPADFPAGAWESASNAIFSPKAGLRYLAGRAWSVRASSARGFRSPAGIIGDPAREPFISWSHELGIDYALGSVAASLSLFRVDVSNERIQDPITLTISSAGSSTRQGLAAVVDWSPAEQIGINARATWNHARLSGAYADAHDDHPHEVFGSGTRPTTPADATVASEYEVPGVAEYQAFLRLSARPFDNVEGWVSGRSVGAHIPVGEPSVRTRPYTVADVGITWAIGQNRALDVELQNLTDVRFVELRSSGFVVPGTPRSVRIQMRIGAEALAHD